MGMLELKTYKNWNEICEVMEWKIIRGTYKKARLKDLDTLCKYHKNGNKFVIDEIYEIPLDKVDNRVNNGQSQGSRGNNNKYMQYSTNILENKFSTLDKAENYYFTTNQLSKECCIINDNFTKAIDKKKSFRKYLNNEGINNQGSFYDIFNKLNDLKRKIIVSGLNKLQKEGKIIFYSNYIICFIDGKIREVEEEELELINNIENNFLKENNLTKKKLMYNDEKKKELYKLIDSALFNLIGEGFRMCYQVFIIMNIKCKSIDIQEDKKNMIIQVKDTIFNSLKKKQDNTIFDAEKELENFDGWGEPYLDWKPYKLKILEDTYLEDAKDIINILVSGNKIKF